MKLRTFIKLNVFLGFWHWTIYLARCTCDNINHYGIPFCILFFSKTHFCCLFFSPMSKCVWRFIMADHDTNEENVLEGGGTSYSTEHHRSTSQWELSLKNPITQWPHIFHSLPPSLTRHWGIVVLLNDTLQVLVLLFFCILFFFFFFSFYESALYS